MAARGERFTVLIVFERAGEGLDDGLPEGSRRSVLGIDVVEDFNRVF